MRTACPCFGRNENCRICDGTGIIKTEAEERIAKNAVQSSYFSGQSDIQKARDAALKNQMPANRNNQPTPLPLSDEVLAERAAKEAEQAAKSIAYWNKRWRK